jgi:hypothetical protein
VGAVAVVVLVLLAVILVQAAVLVPLVLRWRRGSAAFLTDFHDSARASGERIVAGPEKGLYRGGTAPYGSVKGNGTIVLTDRRLVFRKLTGGVVEVPVAKIAGVRTSAGFRGSRVGGMTHLVVDTVDHAEIGFFVNDLGSWERAISSVKPA